ncbi:adenosine deaminase [Massilia sp. WF1]|uniref:adenosine deaminase n=1 Tax=unclassified Massilia TaxID=2609279 RepID=UPI00069174F8|nr:MULTISPECIES: adenosine deaminase [unclassified Massilia]ALK95898.1 adenosine deaminase [Massilia sp. WG5]KNZ67881.1 adenosine deaminase [Massilia sp. WF1]
MQKTLSSSLSLVLSLAAALASAGAGARPTAANANEAATARHYAALIAGSEPKTAELTMFFTQMPKGGDLHHHYSGALYAETYVDFLDKQGYCVNKQTYRIETDKAVVDAERAKPAKERTCLGTAEVYADDFTYRELLQRWSSKDFYNHGAIQAPPDRQFFQTFLYFGPVSNANFHEGLAEIKERAIRENVSYIETMFKLSPFVANKDFDAQAWKNVHDDAAFEAQMRAWMSQLDQDPKFNQSIADFVARIDEASAGIDDERFTMRYQTYVLRLLNPSQVFSSMLSGFKAASKDSKIVGVNIVGQESQMVSMRDYTLHMKMFRFLKSVYPKVKVALHAGELALGDVPPEDLQYHIDQAVNLAGADRIGHGIDLAHESNAVAIMKRMREKDIPVEINLTSNDFIEGVKGENHPVTLYRKYGVPYVISTDDAGVTRHNLANEYVLFASRYKPGYAEIKKASYDSIRYSFLDAAEKARLSKQLDERFAKFEAEIAGLDKASAALKR